MNHRDVVAHQRIEFSHGGSVRIALIHCMWKGSLCWFFPSYHEVECGDFDIELLYTLAHLIVKGSSREVVKNRFHTDGWERVLMAFEDVMDVMDVHSL